MEIIQPKDLGLIVGFHGTRPELRFVAGIVSDVLRPAGYNQPIQVVGSRGEEGLWISRTRFPNYGETDEAIKWFVRFNRLAHAKSLSRIDLPLLLDEIEGEIPLSIEEFMEDDPGSDIDVALSAGRLPGIARSYHDDDTGQTLDLYFQDDEF